MKVQARAKINLALDVVERMDNGYHSLDMIMAPISICDEIEIEIGICDEVTCEGMKLPEKNTVSKMVQVLKELYHLSSNYKISIKKHIPAQAGLGGGSADAAAVCKAILQMEGIEETEENLYEITKQVGQMCLSASMTSGQESRVLGKKSFRLKVIGSFNIIVVKPDFGISTANAFSKWKESRPFHPDVDLVESSIREKNMDLLYQTMANALEQSHLRLSLN